MPVELHELARRLLADYDGRTQGQHAGEHLDLTTNQAYALQAEITKLREQRGEKVVGYKVGCTSRTIREQLGVEEPVFGRLFDTECHLSGASLSLACFANLAVEGEMAIRLAKDLPGQRLSREQCREAVAEVFPVIELHHYVLPETWPVGPWIIASNGMHAGWVRAVASAQPRCSGSANVDGGLRIQINEVVVEAVEDASSLVCPIDSLCWLIGRLAPLGLRLRKGQTILTGSPMKLYPVAPNSRVVVEAPALGMSCVAINA